MKEFLKSHIKPFLQTVAFFVIFVLIFLHVQNIFNLKGSGYTKRMYFRDEADNTINVMFFGNSRCNRGMNPSVIDPIAGTYSYNMAIQGLRSSFVYVRMKDAFKTQTPKLIAIETSIFTPPSTPGLEESYGQRTLMSIPVSPFKLASSIELASLIDGDLGKKATRASEYFLPLLRFHSRYEELGPGDFVYDLINMGDYDYSEAQADKCIIENRGYTIYAKNNKLEQTTKTSFFDKDHTSITDVAELDGTSYDYLNKIVELAKDKGAKILFFSIPAMGAKKDSRVTEPIMNFLKTCYENDPDVKFLDFYEHLNEIGLDYEHFQNKEHLNIEGAKLASEFMGNFIKDNYDASMWN
ncbi:MAG: hypothetical protein ILP10_01275 [Lachnospiraceae bacterium]|nr:hypothetical protein [Lachnospiraceae bacterium]